MNLNSKSAFGILGGAIGAILIGFGIEELIEAISKNDKKDYYKQDFDQQGYNSAGYNRQGFDPEGFDKDGFGLDGFDRIELDQKGYDRSGFDSDGFDRCGRDTEGYDRASCCRQFYSSLYRIVAGPPKSSFSANAI